METYFKDFIQALTDKEKEEVIESFNKYLVENSITNPGEGDVARFILHAVQAL